MMCDRRLNSQSQIRRIPASLRPRKRPTNRPRLMVPIQRLIRPNHPIQKGAPRRLPGGKASREHAIKLSGSRKPLKKPNFELLHFETISAYLVKALASEMTPPLRLDKRVID